MQLSNSLIDAALNSVFNNASRTYTLVLVFNNATESSPNTIDFTNVQVIGSGRGVSLASSTYFATQAGDTVVGIKVYDDLAETYLQETLSVAKTYTANGTFTVSMLSIILEVV